LPTFKNPLKYWDKSKYDRPVAGNTTSTAPTSGATTPPPTGATGSTPPTGGSATTPTGVTPPAGGTPTTGSKSLPLAQALGLNANVKDTTIRRYIGKRLLKIRDSLNPRINKTEWNELNKACNYIYGKDKTLTPEQL